MVLFARLRYYPVSQILLGIREYFSDSYRVRRNSNSTDNMYFVFIFTIVTFLRRLLGIVF